MITIGRNRTIVVKKINFTAIIEILEVPEGHGIDPRPQVKIVVEDTECMDDEASGPTFNETGQRFVSAFVNESATGIVLTYGRSRNRGIKTT